MRLVVMGDTLGVVRCAWTDDDDLLLGTGNSLSATAPRSSFITTTLLYSNELCCYDQEYYKT